MTACWVALIAAAFVLGFTIAVVPVVHRRRRHFEPLPELERLEPADNRLVTRWPPHPVRVLRDPVLYDAEAEGWWPDA